jgi:hypothetical protein
MTSYLDSSIILMRTIRAMLAGMVIAGVMFGVVPAWGRPEPKAQRISTLTVMDRKTSQPLSGVKMAVSFTSGTVDLNLITDNKGRVTIPLPVRYFTWDDGLWRTNYLKIGFAAPGYVREELKWHYEFENGSINSGLLGVTSQVWLDKIAPIGGRVVDTAGHPIEGVRISADEAFFLPPDIDCHFSMRGKTVHEEARTGGPVKLNCWTDRQGRWRYENLPAIESVMLQSKGQRNFIKGEIVYEKYPSRGITLHVDHDDYLADWNTKAGVEWWQEKDYQVYTTDDCARLREGKLQITMQHACGVEIYLRDERGRPVTGANLNALHNNGYEYLSGRQVAGQAPGVYMLKHLRKSEGFVLVHAKGYGLALEPVKYDYPLPVKTITLKRSLGLRGQLVDQFGKPCQGYLEPYIWRNIKKDTFASALVTDAQGRFEWNEAPEDPVVFSYTISYKNYMCPTAPFGLFDPYTEGMTTMTQRAEPYEVRVKRNLHIRGQVFDAETGKPIKQYNIFRGYERRPGEIEWQAWAFDTAELRSEEKYYYVVMHGLVPRHHLRAEAPGYETTFSRVFEKEAGRVDYDFRLKPVGKMAK